MLDRLSGVFVANVTPFDKDGKVSYARLHAHLEFLASRGVHGFVPCGTTGEAATLTPAERRKVIACTREVAVAKGLPVIAGCGGNSTSNVLELIVEAKELGCDAALVVTPYYNKPTPAGLIAHFRFLADHGGLPIVLYNVPSRTGIHLGVETVAQLFEHPNIIGIKEASGQYGHWLALAAAVNTSSRALLAGDDDGLAPLMGLGGTGIISASANAVPDLLVAIHAHAKDGRLAEAFRLQKRLYPLVRALFLETNPAPIKYALEVLGHGEAHLRLPLVPISAGTEAAVRAALKALELLQ